MEEDVGDEGSRTKMKGFAWRQGSPGRWSQRRCSSSISTVPTCFWWPASDEMQGSGSVEVSECSGVDERAQSGGTAHGVQGDPFMVEVVSRERGGAVHSAGGARRGGGVGGTMHGGGGLRTAVMT
jgi:hypothetical protein